MRALIQRAARAEVRVDGVVTGSIDAGLCVLVGVTHGEAPEAPKKIAAKLWNLRLMADGDGNMNRSVGETTGEVLVVSQFTLYGDAKKGRRPSYVAAASPEYAETRIDELVAELRALGAHVETGVFGAMMEVDLVNDGPVTLMIEA